MPWVIPISIVLMAFHLTRVQRTVFRVPGGTDEVRRAAATIGSYSAAPLLLLVPAALCYGIAALIAWNQKESSQPIRSQTWEIAMIVAICLGGLLYLLALIGTFLRVGQWVARATHAGAWRVGLALVELWMLWCFGAGLFVFLFPWCVGFVWIVIDSFR